MLQQLERQARNALPPQSQSEFCSIRLVEDLGEAITTRRGVLEPLSRQTDVGALVSVMHHGGYGYAATGDTSSAGLKAAVQRAQTWAEKTRRFNVFHGDLPTLPHPQGEYRSRVEKPWGDSSFAEKLEIVQAADRRLAAQEPVVDWSASLWWQNTRSLYLTNGDGQVFQEQQRLAPELSITATQDGVTQSRSLGGYAYMRQAGLECLEELGFLERANTLGQEVRQLLAAPNCPSGNMDVVLLPDQMILQLHESIGHPLELDRILGDERNYAGQSFVSLDMFGSYQYGSELLTVYFDPDVSLEAASYAYDDEGQTAERQVIIDQGLLKRPLGGLSSAARAAKDFAFPPPQVANARSSSWNRPAIDRMANLNLAPGKHSLSELITQVERGVLMKTNCSWSIDDSRNKFQFGCEWGQWIEDGELKHVVRNPNYRGISANFWRNLTGVGNDQEVMAAVYCGKGEPNQAVNVGHATPSCRFSHVDVFGGE